MRSSKNTAGAVLGAALLLVLQAPAAAGGSCPEIGVDGAASGELVGELVAHGIDAEVSPPCDPTVRLVIEPSAAGLRVEAVSATGKRRVQEVPSVRAAVVLVGSWLDVESSAPLLIVPLPSAAVGIAPLAAALPVVPVQRPAGASVRTAPARSPAPSLGLAAELGASHTGTRIAALRLRMLRRVRWFDWGVDVRAAYAGPGDFSEGHLAAPTGLKRELARTELGVGGRAAIAWQVLGVHVAPSLGLGLTWQRHRMQAAHLDAGLMHDTMWTMAPRLEAAIDLAVPLTRATSLVVGAAAGGVALARAPDLAQSHWAAPKEARLDLGGTIAVQRTFR